MKMPNPVIVVPGITASYLRDDYPIPPLNVWTVLPINRRYDRVELHPDNLRYEAAQPSRVRPGGVFEVAYEELIAELRYNLTPYSDMPVPVYAFDYDWRQPLEATERQLADFMQEVVDRTKLMRHYAAPGAWDPRQVNLVGHSMGGLIIAGYLASAGGSAPVGKVVSLASPFRGSFEAVIKTVTGTADLGGASASSRERETARVTPALYHLMPNDDIGLKFNQRFKDASIFDPSAWQPSILASVAEYVRLHAVEPGETPDAQAQQANELFAAMLQTAKTHRDKLESATLSGMGLGEQDWMAVVGVGADTRVALSVEPDEEGRPFFMLSSKDRKDTWKPKAPKQGSPDRRTQTGDGTVPFKGAQPAFLKRENLVCVWPDDFGYWEFKDRALTKGVGFHGILPNMNMLHRLIVQYFTQTSHHNNTWGYRAPGVDKDEWKPPIKGLKDKTKKA